MTDFTIETQQEYDEFISCLADGSAEVLAKSDNILQTSVGSVMLSEEYKNKLAQDDLIYGKNKLSHITNISYKNDNVHIFREFEGKIQENIMPFAQYVLSPHSATGAQRLTGDTHYKYIKEYATESAFLEIKKNVYKYRLYHLNYPPEAFMTRHGYTYFKGMKPKELSMVSFDIETSGLNNQAKNATIYLITNTYRKGDYYENKTFNCDDYKDNGEMLLAWCEWIRDVNPSLILGHNIYVFDLPYIRAIANKFNVPLELGRDGSELFFEERPREKRKDGSQSYSYHRPICFGRDMLDTFFLVLTADSQRQLTSYALKSIIKELGMEEEGRVFIDAGKINEYWKDPVMRDLVIKYGEADSRDSIKLYDHYATPFFYFTNHIPKPFQLMMESATGSQINMFLVRAYLQNNESIPMATDLTDVKVEGGISFAVPGIYRNMVKVDLKSAYPSQILRFKLYDEKKDPKAYFYEMVKHFTYARFEYKRLGKETGDSHYKDLDAVSKIFINSSYGVTNTNGLHFNNSEIAKKITGESRAVIDMALRWASGNNKDYWMEKFRISVGKDDDEIPHLSIPVVLPVNKSYDFTIGATDTDSISFSKADMSPISPEEVKVLTAELNSISPNMMVWEDDGYFECMICFKAKNYVLYDGKKIKLKGSSLIDQKREPALREMTKLMIDDLVFNSGGRLVDIYENYIREAKSPDDIMRWAQKKTVTKAITNCAKDPDARANERVVYDAIKHKHIQEGDKVYLFPCILDRQIETTVTKNGKEKHKEILKKGLCLADEWVGQHDYNKLVERVVATIEILANVVVMSKFIDYSLVKNKLLLEEL